MFVIIEQHRGLHEMGGPIWHGDAPISSSNSSSIIHLIVDDERAKKEVSYSFPAGILYRIVDNGWRPSDKLTNLIIKWFEGKQDRKPFNADTEIPPGERKCFLKDKDISDEGTEWYAGEGEMFEKLVTALYKMLYEEDLPSDKHEKIKALVVKMPKLPTFFFSNTQAMVAALCEVGTPADFFSTDGLENAFLLSLGIAPKVVKAPQWGITEKKPDVLMILFECEDSIRNMITSTIKEKFSDIYIADSYLNGNLVVQLNPMLFYRNFPEMLKVYKAHESGSLKRELFTGAQSTATATPTISFVMPRKVPKSPGFSQKSIRNIETALGLEPDAISHITKDIMSGYCLMLADGAERLEENEIKAKLAEKQVEGFAIVFRGSLQLCVSEAEIKKLAGGPAKTCGL